MNALRVAPYGFARPTSREDAFVSVLGDNDIEFRFVRLASLDRPFDHLVRLSDCREEIVPLSQAEFAFAVVNEAGRRQQFREIGLRL